MGARISTASFSKASIEDFSKKVKEETELLREWFLSKKIAQTPHQVGFELEFSVLDKNFHPAHVNLNFIRALSCHAVVPELCKPSLEINTDYFNVEKDVLKRAKENLEHYWRLCESHARAQDLNAIQIGILPNSSLEDFNVKTFTELKRYSELNENLTYYRHTLPFHLLIKMKDQLDLYQKDVGLMGATAAFQIHFRVGLDESVPYYNASLLLAGPLLAVCSNSPFLLQKELWEETRVPLFEQSINFKTNGFFQDRVSLGEQYISQSWMELFDENLKFSPLLICHSPEKEPLLHLRFHNGTIHRWLRPVVDVSNINEPHLRIENRILPAGPSIEDMIANAALYIGAMNFFAKESLPPEARLSFKQVKENFYAAARYGLDAYFHWGHHHHIPADVFVHDFLIPAAHRGLQQLQVSQDDIDYYLNIIEQRLSCHKTGSIWQRYVAHKNKNNLEHLVEQYLEMQYSQRPVYAWAS